jgi:tRNA(adenine34) deaminase
MLAIREAARALGSWRLEGCEMFVTLEPCAMCAGAIVLARLDRVTFGAWDEKAGMAGSVGDLLRHPRLNHRPEVVSGVMSDDCAALLRDFFAARRTT